VFYMFWCIIVFVISLFFVSYYLTSLSTKYFYVFNVSSVGVANPISGMIFCCQARPKS